MAPDGPSNIRVFIRWHDQTVFAGEEVKCTITFKNVAPGAGQPKQQPPQSERSRLASPLQARPKLDTMAVTLDGEYERSAPEPHAQAFGFHRLDWIYQHC
ncbi:hypothetical protein ACJ41O_002204 [Fusarium nematophilum]